MTSRLLQIAWVLAVACGGAEVDARSSDSAPLATGGPRTLSGADTVLVAANSDSVVVRADSGERKLFWTRTVRGERIVLFRSGGLHAGIPTARLVDANGDGQSDLFLQWWFEEQVSAVLLLGADKPDAAVAYTSPLGLCRPPFLADVDGDGTWDIVERWPGAVSLDDCTGGGRSEDCIEDYAADWQLPLFRSPQTGAYQVDSVRARAFFGDRTRAYSATIEALRRKRSENSRDACISLIAPVDSLLAEARRMSESRR